jgi:hypothetical protein
MSTDHAEEMTPYPALDPQTRERQQVLYDGAAADYDRSRPGYPPEVFKRLTEVQPPPARALEIGPGTGQATMPLLDVCYEVVAVERGEDLASLLCQKGEGRPPSCRGRALRRLARRAKFLRAGPGRDGVPLA